jgi:hypothetical protein
MKDNDRAFPGLMSFTNDNGVQRIESGTPGITLKWEKEGNCEL